MGGVERNKQARRRLIINAAERLVESTYSTDFSMPDLARLSGVSIQTIYNLFGSKSSLLFVLLNNAIDAIDVRKRIDHSSDGPISEVFYSADVVVSTYLARPSFYGALLRHLFGEVDKINRPHYINRGRKYWFDALDPIYEMWPECDVLQVEIADEIFLHTIGVFEDWIQDEISDAQFRAKIFRGVAVCLLSLGIEGNRERLLSIVSSTREVLSVG